MANDGDDVARPANPAATPGGVAEPVTSAATSGSAAPGGAAAPSPTGDAAAWVGASKGAEDTLDLGYIKDQTSPHAKDLLAILDDASVSGLFEMRRDASRSATRAQSTFKLVSAVAVAGTAVAALASGFLLYGEGGVAALADAEAAGLFLKAAASETPPEPGVIDWVQGNRPSILGIQIVGLIAATVGSALLGSRNYVTRWTDNRRSAEDGRREIFSAALKFAERRVPAPLAAADPGNPVRQVLEFFRRYQLDLQIGYFEKNRTRHGRWAGVLAWVAAILAGIAAVSGLVSGLGAAWPIIAAFLGIVIPVLLSAAQSWRLTHLDTEKEQAYAKTKREMQEARRELSAVQAKADLEDVAAVKAYIDRVHLILAAENEAWKPANPGTQSK